MDTPHHGDPPDPGPPSTYPAPGPAEPGGPGPILVVVVVALAGIALLVLAAVRFLGGGDGDDGDGGGSAATTTLPAGDGFVTVSDESGRITVEVPEAWDDVEGSPWAPDGQPIGPALTAAEDVDDWISGWGTPGLFIGVDDAPVVTPAELLDALDFSDACEAEVDRVPLDRPGLIGEVQTYSGCGAEGSTFVQAAAIPDPAGPLVLLQVVLLDDAAPLARILETWSVE